ncbi:hypothetical protein GPX89_09315 [Nocardia sp. ET3-3]|uniref:Uncharacterized protein n=1 Tax=Nocardia terrae TaxID=2675851 RepID=A0A7K1USW4_9NOCA|nr:hypothetical protein [Nocardia terrae]MVU77446.1 hypothetical protein [Nocardia terrae]
MTSTDDGSGKPRPRESTSLRGRGTAVTAASLALAMSIYGVVGAIYIAITRVSPSELEELLEWKVASRDVYYAPAAFIVIVIMLLYGSGAVLLVRRDPIGRRIVLVVTAFLAIVAGPGIAGTRGVLLLGNLVGMAVMALTFSLAWVRPTRLWVGLDRERS